MTDLPSQEDDELFDDSSRDSIEDPPDPLDSPRGWLLARQWMPLIDNPDILRLSRLHSKYPERLQEKWFQQVSAQLESDARVQEALERLQRLRDQQLEKLTDWLERAADRMRKELASLGQADLPAGTEAREAVAWNAFLTQVGFTSRQMLDLYESIDSEAQTLSKCIDASSFEIRIYLDDQLLSRVWSQQQEPSRWLEPFELLVNKSQTPFPTILQPGHVALTFQRLAIRDLSSEIGPLVIEALQLAGGQDPSKGGRPSRLKNPEHALIDRIAAKLHHWDGWTYARLAVCLGWDGDDDVVRERVRRAVRSGEKLLVRELGPEWKTKPPEAFYRVPPK